MTCCYRNPSQTRRSFDYDTRLDNDFNSDAALRGVWHGRNNQPDNRSDFKRLIDATNGSLKVQWSKNDAEIVSALTIKEGALWQNNKF